MIRGLSDLILAVILFVLSGHFAAAEPAYVRFDADVCHRPSQAKEWGLSEKQIEVLCQASHFTATLLKKGDQFIVLVGESHTTTAQGQKEAMAILEMFPLRGLEGVSNFLDELITPISSGAPMPDFQFYSLINVAKTQGLLATTFVKPRVNWKSDGKEFTMFILNLDGPQPSESWGYPKYFRKRVYPSFRNAFPDMPLNFNLEPDNKLFDLRIRNRALQLCKKNIPCTDIVVLDYRNAIMREMAEEIVKLFPEEKVLLMAVGEMHIPGLVRSFVCSSGYKRHTLSLRGRFNMEQARYLARLEQAKKTSGTIVPEPLTEYFEWPEENCANE